MNKRKIAESPENDQLEIQANTAKDTLTTLRENGSGAERKNIPFRPYAETSAELKRLAVDLEIERGEVVKVHDLLIEAINDLFKKYNRNHVAERPTRSKK